MARRTNIPGEQVWQMITEAANSPLTREQVVEQLVIALRRNLSYLVYREARGRRTAYDEALERDLEATAKAIWLLQHEGNAPGDHLDDA